MTQIHYEVRNHIAEITLDHAPANALTEEMVGELIGALDRAGADVHARAVIISSAVPRRFCAGLDLAVLAGASAAKIRSLLEKLYPGICSAQFNLNKPSIAAVTCSARGCGMTLPISCGLIASG